VRAGGRNRPVGRERPLERHGQVIGHVPQRVPASRQPPCGRDRRYGRRAPHGGAGRAARRALPHRRSRAPSEELRERTPVEVVRVEAPYPSRAVSGRHRLDDMLRLALLADHPAVLAGFLRLIESQFDTNVIAAHSAVCAASPGIGVRATGLERCQPGGSLAALDGASTATDRPASIDIAQGLPS